MATQTAASGRVNLELESLRLMIGDLADVAADWPKLSDAERASWSLDWDQVMGSLEAVLDPAYRAGSMTPDQQGRYQDLLCRLRGETPTLARLGLQRPAIPLEI
jgi:hypothetical protein